MRVMRNEYCVTKLKSSHLCSPTLGYVWRWLVLRVLLCLRVSSGWRRWLSITWTPRCCSSMPQTRALRSSRSAVCCTLWDCDLASSSLNVSVCSLARIRNFFSFAACVCAALFKCFFKTLWNKCHNIHNLKRSSLCNVVLCYLKSFF